jgi:hypothetical protein
VYTAIKLSFASDLSPPITTAVWYEDGFLLLCRLKHLTISGHSPLDKPCSSPWRCNGDRSRRPEESTLDGQTHGILSLSCAAFAGIYPGGLQETSFSKILIWDKWIAKD